MRPPLKFPDWCYRGPYLRVSDPDADLPRRNPKVPISPETQAEVERDGLINGERYVAPLADDNSISDIIAGLEWASTYPEYWNKDQRFFYPTIQGLLAQLAWRLEAKLRRKQKPAHASASSLALARVREAAPLFAAKSFEEARKRVTEALNLIVQL